jgi:Ni,Fe-hydrogenase III small subunit
MQAALQRTFEATPDPKLVLAVGECGANGGEFGVSYASCGAVANVIPVDAVVRGCPPTPLDLMRGILEAIGKRANRKE